MTLAVIIPCRNEALTIGKVVRDFREALPEAQIVVCDNGSTDETYGIALHSDHTTGVILEPKQGKGNAVGALFKMVESDIYLMVDGDDTYDAGTARAMVDTLTRYNLDMVTAIREPNYRDPVRQLGNGFLNIAARVLVGAKTKDLLSGYRVMSRRFVKSFPCRSTGFDLEPEIVMWAQRGGFKLAEMPSPYRARPKGSKSKIRLVQDGLVVLCSICRFGWFGDSVGIAGINERIVRHQRGEK